MTSRRCEICGRLHDTVIQDMDAGVAIEEIDPCYDCLIGSCYFTPIGKKIHIEAHEIKDEMTAKQMEALLNNKLNELLLVNKHSGGDT